MHDDLLFQQSLVFLSHHPHCRSVFGRYRRVNFETPYVSDEQESFLRFLLHVVNIELVLIHHKLFTNLDLSVCCASAL